MSNKQISRGSGIVVLIGAVAFAVHIVLRSVIAAGGEPVEYAPEAPWLAVNALGVVGAGLVLLGLPALYGADGEQRPGRAGWRERCCWRWRGCFLAGS